MTDRDTSLPGGFAVPALAVVAATCAIAAWVASREWFYGDDFVFLKLAQMPRDWLQIFLPLEPRLWWSYRPLTIEVFFAAGVALFGLQALPFLLFVLLVHAASGIVLYRIALQLGFERRTAFFAGCLLVVMYPSLHELFWASTFQPVGGIFFYLLSVSFFLAYLDSRRLRWLVASLIAQVLLVTSNELGITLPGVIAMLAAARVSGFKNRLLEAVRRTWPYALILAAYLLLRFVILPPALVSAPAFYYQPTFGPHILRNIGSYFLLLTHEHWVHAAATAALLALGWFAVLRGGDPESRRRLGRRTVLTTLWMIMTMVPFLGIWYAQHRMVMVMEPAFCLLVAAHLEAAWSRWGRRHPQVLEWAMVLTLAAAVPYQTLLERGRKPLGALNRQIVALMRDHFPDGPQRGTCVALQAHDPAEWRPGDLFAVWFVTSGLLSAVYPEQAIELRVPDHKSLRETPPAHCTVIEVVSRQEARFGRFPLQPPPGRPRG